MLLNINLQYFCFYFIIHSSDAFQNVGRKMHIIPETWQEILLSSCVWNGKNSFVMENFFPEENVEEKVFPDKSLTGHGMDGWVVGMWWLWFGWKCHGVLGSFLGAIIDSDENISSF
jgi:hypothetical protein